MHVLNIQHWILNMNSELDQMLHYPMRFNWIKYRIFIVSFSSLLVFGFFPILYLSPYLYFVRRFISPNLIGTYSGIIILLECAPPSLSCYQSIYCYANRLKRPTNFPKQFNHWSLSKSILIQSSTVCILY